MGCDVARYPRLPDFQALGKKRCSSTCTCTFLLYTHENSTEIKQTQKKASHGNLVLDARLL
jgi:hypothetical protein